MKKILIGLGLIVLLSTTTLSSDLTPYVEKAKLNTEMLFTVIESKDVSMEVYLKLIELYEAVSENCEILIKKDAMFDSLSVKEQRLLLLSTKRLNKYVEETIETVRNLK